MSSYPERLPAGRLRYRAPCAQDLCVPTPSVTVSQTNESVLEVFTSHRDLACLPVTEDDKPIGLINRSIFMSQMSKPYHRELYSRKSCIAFMDKEPLVVDSATSLEALTFKAVEYGEKALAEGFLITQDGKFIGLGHGLHLMRMVADIQAERNRQLMQSIDYASIIQRSMLRPSREAVTSALGDACLVWEPRDTVGGDFYHFSGGRDGWFAAVGDCTGHGVPGAFMTLIASTILSQALALHGPRSPGRLLMAVNQGIKNMLGQVAGGEVARDSDDGMDAAFFWFDRASHALTIAGAKCGALLLHPGDSEFTVVDGERVSVGYVGTDADYCWQERTVATVPGTLVFVTTDGLIDQIGGPRDIAFGKRRLREVILANRHAPAADIGQAVQDQLRQWQGVHH